MGDFTDLGKNLKDLSGLIETNVSKAIRLTALAIDQQLVISTPVDTGRARSNWIVSTSSSPRFTRAPFAEGSKLGIGESANARGSLQHGQSVIKSHKPGQTIYISNNVEYIGSLNDGSSAQAPMGFIEAAIQKGQRVIDKVKIL